MEVKKKVMLMNSKWFIIKNNEELPAETDVFLCYVGEKGDRKFTIGGSYYQDENSHQYRVVYDKMNDEIINNVFAYMPFPEEIL